MYKSIRKKCMQGSTEAVCDCNQRTNLHSRPEMGKAGCRIDVIDDVIHDQLSAKWHSMYKSRVLYSTF